MRYEVIGGIKFSVVGLGTWQFGSRAWAYGSEYSDREALMITKSALALGVNLIDTAEVYGRGRSERIVGEAVRNADPDVVVATKLYPAAPVGPVVRWRASRSRRRLALPRIPLYQLHGVNPLVPMKSTMAGMAQAQRAGIIEHVGVSNFWLPEWRRAESALGGPIVSNQVRFNLIAREIERDVLPWAQTNDRVLIAHSPLAQGFLSGKYDGHRRPSGNRAKSPLFTAEGARHATTLLTSLRVIASGHGATEAQVALAWVLRRPNVVAIPGARTVDQLKENVEAAELALTDEEDRELTEASSQLAFSTVGKSLVSRARTALRRRQADRV